MRIKNLQTVVPAVATLDENRTVLVFVDLINREVYTVAELGRFTDSEEFTEQVLAEFATGPAEAQIPQVPSHMVATVNALRSDSEHQYEAIKERVNVNASRTPQ